LLTIKSCGIVLLFYAGAVATELVFGLWSLFFGAWSFVGQLGAAGLLAIALVFAERHDDEHLVPSAIRYYTTRRWRILYSGARAEDYRGHDLEGVVVGGPWQR
jgi:hypothetical protein